MIDLSNYGKLQYGDLQNYLFCKTYDDIKKTPFKPIERRNDSFGDCLNLLHIIVVKPMNVKTYNREEYFIPFVDEGSKFNCVYLLQSMSQTL